MGLGLLAAACSQQVSGSSDRPADKFTVERGDMQIRVSQAAEIQAFRETRVRSEVEGSNTVIFLIPEGREVKAGEKLVELDSSALVERKAKQEIDVARAESQLVTATKEYEIQLKQFAADVKEAENQVLFAELDLDKFLGKKRDTAPGRWARRSSRPWPPPPTSSWPSPSSRWRSTSSSGARSSPTRASSPRTSSTATASTWSGGPGQIQDAGSKMVHFAPNTTSKTTSKSISKGGGRASYRGLLKVYKGAKGVKSNVVCDALLLDPKSRSDTYPYIEIDEDDVTIGHKASVSKVGEEQVFYLMSRGLSEEEATTMVVSGFIEPLVKELPMEYAVEMNRLIALQMEGSIG